MNQADTRGAPSAPRSTWVLIILALVAALVFGVLFILRGQTPAARPPAPTQEAAPIGQGAP